MSINNKISYPQEAPVENLSIKSRSLWGDALSRFMKNRLAVFSMFMLLLLLLFVIIVPMISPFEYDDTDWSMISMPPDFASGHYFGTDMTGRDLLVRVAVGGRVSLSIGILTALLSVGIGLFVGCVMGYFGGRTDFFLMRFIEILDAVPFMFLVILMVAIFGRNLTLLFIAIAVTSWSGVARVVRGSTMSLQKQEFVDAAITCGAGKFSIIIRHIIPNLLGIVIIMASSMVPSMILAESMLSFLGLGTQEPFSSWGALISDGSSAFIGALWLLVFPSIFLVITLFCLLFIGDGLRDAFDPKDR
ncbi:ABC transporter permease subunit [Bartonella sp. DGB1]|uniref:ABC transporter permease subunit n=1 Tax=Bartonella sp. DGB1 TaxID=3239807 RepID=UPI003526C101